MRMKAKNTGGRKETMGKQRGLRRLGLGLVLAAMGVFALLWHHIQTSECKNVMTKGRVKISLQDLDGQEEAESEVEYIKPGDTISRSLQISVEEGSQPAYLRVWLATYGLNARQKEELVEGIILEEGWNWNERDGYFYYQGQILEGEEIVFSCRMTIPESWELLEEQPVFQFQVMAEAVETAYARSWGATSADISESGSGT